jgi:hypothetical protein
MSIDISVSVEIKQPAEGVAAYVTDPAHEPDWIQGIHESMALTPDPIGVGSRARRTSSFMGRRIEYTPVVTEYEQGCHLQMSTDQPFPMTIDYDFSELPVGTRFTQRLRGGPSGIAGMLSPLMAMMVRRNIRADMERLRHMLDGG